MSITSSRIIKTAISTTYDVNSQAMIILLDAVGSGESWRTATEKAVEYLKTHPGYENSARSLVEGLERMEAKHGK